MRREDIEQIHVVAAIERWWDPERQCGGCRMDSGTMGSGKEMAWKERFADLRALSKKYNISDQ
jgi:hypothetical protein